MGKVTEKVQAKRSGDVEAVFDGMVTGTLVLVYNSVRKESLPEQPASLSSQTGTFRLQAPSYELCGLE